ncbi:unnamed protein product [Lota lota]
MISVRSHTCVCHTTTPLGKVSSAPNDVGGFKSIKPSTTELYTERSSSTAQSSTLLPVHTARAGGHRCCGCHGSLASYVSGRDAGATAVHCGGSGDQDRLQVGWGHQGPNPDPFSKQSRHGRVLPLCPPCAIMLFN